MAVRQPEGDAVSEALKRPMQVVDITTVGRTSGKSRRIEIVLHNIGGRLYISGMPRPERRSWLANLDANPRFTVHLKQGVHMDLDATAREITDLKERREVLDGVARHWKRKDLDTMVRWSPLIELTLNQ
jgi:deazaflavin-dependent oxidoreductase (nitroreductase family)